MEKIVLPNGMTLILEKSSSNSVTIGVCVKTGSINEKKEDKGISHVIEHVLFEGTKKRKAEEISREIEKVGGEINAFTDFEVTFYYIKILGKYFDKALDVLTDILKNSLFNEEKIKKEIKVILEERNLWIDDPKLYQWILFHKLLYKKHPAKYPIIGFKETLRKVNRKKILNYYNKYYVPNNMIMVVTGNFNLECKNKIINNFNELKPRKIKQEKIDEPLQKKIEKYKEKRKISNSYFILGFKTVNRRHKDSYVIDIISTILGFGQSSRLFREIRTKLGLAYNIGINHECDKTFGNVAAYVNAEYKNIPLCKDIILKEFKLNNLSNEEINDAKKMIEGIFLLNNENTKELALSLASWEHIGKAEEFYNYIKNIKKVTKKDMLRVANKYFKNYAEVLIYN